MTDLFLKSKYYGGCCDNMQLGKKCKERRGLCVDSTVILQGYDTYICSHSCECVSDIFLQE